MLVPEQMYILEPHFNVYDFHSEIGKLNRI